MPPRNYRTTFAKQPKQHPNDFTVECEATIHDMVFTKGKIYEVINGSITNNLGQKYSHYNNIRQLNRDMKSKFKLVED